MKIPYHYEPRDYQIPIMKAISDDKIRYIIQVWSRRNGKDMTGINAVISQMVREPMGVSYVFPQLNQGRTALWENIENDGFRTIDHFPKELVKRMDNGAMSVELINGSIFRILGTNNDDDVEKLRGANSKIYVFSEFADIHPRALDIISPIITANGGKAVLNGTPKLDGRNGAAFKKMFDSMKDKPNALVSFRDAVGIIPAEDLELERQRSIDKYGNDFFFRQEYLCDWGQVSSGSYYGDKLSMIEKDNHMGAFAYNPNYPVYTAWDLGIADDTAIWFFQIIGKKLYVIDYMYNNDVGINSYIQYVNNQPYKYAEHFFPHDAADRDKYDGESMIQQIREKGGLINSTVLRKLSRESGIKNAVESLNDVYFDTANQRVKNAIETLKLYKRQYNELTGEYLGAKHDSSSHAADSFRYMIQGFRIICGDPDVIKKVEKPTEQILGEIIEKSKDPFKRIKEYHKSVETGQKRETIFSRPPSSEWL